MLDVRRAGVSEVAFTLQRSGLIEYHRGQITIQDRKGLEASAVNAIKAPNKSSGACLADP